MRVYDLGGAGSSFSVKTSTGMASHSDASARSRNARLDQRVFHQRLVEIRDAKGDPVVGKQRSSHGLDSGELLRSLSRKFKNVTAANRNSRQLTEVNEALERKECFFDVDQPLSDLI